MISRLQTKLAAQAHIVFDECVASLNHLVGDSTMPIGTPHIRVVSSGPSIDIEKGSFTLLVGPNALTNESTLFANVAHESVHLHFADGTFGRASGLEEGFATYFELSLVQLHFGGDERSRHVKYLPTSYLTALQDYNYLRTLSANPIREVREYNAAVTEVSRRQLRMAFPGLGWLRARRLAQCRRMRRG